MKNEVGTFGDQVIAVISDRRNHGLDRFLAHLLGAVLRTLVEELPRIGGIPAGCSAGIDGGGQIVDRETRHHSTNYIGSAVYSGSPSGRHIALLSRRVVRDRAASASPGAPCGPWLGGW